jgi:membrane-bound lytic murein transglycosylase D
LAIIFTLFILPKNGFCQKKDIAKYEAKGFKSLFPNNYFDSTKPYTAQLNPLAISFVENYIKTRGKELNKMKLWGKPYFTLYDNILKQYNIPLEMKYLSVIESHLQSNLVSWAGAVGPWQLMDYEAKRFGLKMGALGDERTDFAKSTHVACKLMKELYAQFGDWLLVVAAYNGGAGRVKRAIAKSGSKEFWDLQYLLMEETRNHVKKFIATHYVFEGRGGITTVTLKEKNQQNLSENFGSNIATNDTLCNQTITISGRYNSNILCKTIGYNIDNFTALNFNFDKTLSQGKSFTLRLPIEKLELFLAKKNEILMLSIQTLLEKASIQQR